jgi:N6-adenosine-specific RNA methylase IME4
MRTDIEAHMPGPYVELFARQSAPGWSIWGNETSKFDHKPIEEPYVDC